MRNRRYSLKTDDNCLTVLWFIVKINMKRFSAIYLRVYFWLCNDAMMDYMVSQFLLDWAQLLDQPKICLLIVLPLEVNIAIKLIKRKKHQ